MRSLEELLALIAELKALNEKLDKLSDEELELVRGGFSDYGTCVYYKLYIAIGSKFLGKCGSCSHKKHDTVANKWYCDLQSTRSVSL